MPALPLILLSSMVFSASAQADSANADMTKIVDGFYRAYESFHPPDGVPDASVRGRFEPFISSSLKSLLDDAASAQNRYQQLTKGKYPPLIEGDPFTPNFDGATSYSVGTCASDTRGAHCAVALTFDGGKDKPRSWTDTVRLVHTNDGWRVNDIDYGGTWDAGNAGRLSETLRSAIEHGDELKQ